ncbi:hypothetical protein PFISCL1PPCAC_16037, partial [Pristionchus fissidentatus]
RFFVLLALFSVVDARRCYSCTSAADCLAVGVGRIQECAAQTQCYAVQFNGRVQLKGCAASCGHVERHSELHACHTCQGDLCNTHTTGSHFNAEGDHHHRRHGRREARRHNDNIGSGVGVGGGAGIGSGAGVNHGSSGIGSGASMGNGMGSGIGSGASMGSGYGSGASVGGGIGSGASMNGGGIGGGVAPSESHGSHKKHHKRNIGHGAGVSSSIGGGVAPIGGGAQPGWNSYNPGAGSGIGGGAAPGVYPSNVGYNEQQGYGGIGSGVRPMSASLHASLLSLVAPLIAFVARR